MADVTISGLDAAVPPAGAVIPYSDGTNTRKVNINSIVGLTTNGAFRGTLQRGSYGSLTISGSNNTYSGIDFTDASATFMIRNSDGLAGVYKNNNSWAWYFDGSGNLVQGNISWAQVTGKPSIPSVDSQQLAKAWVCFDGINVAIRRAYNVTSVTRNNNGIYTLTFAPGTMPNGNYSVCGSVNYDNTVNTTGAVFFYVMNQDSSTCQVGMRGLNGVSYNCHSVSCQFFY